MPHLRPVLVLGVAETLVWASTFYLFPALLPIWETELGWSKAQLTGGYTLALIVSALAAPQMGVLIDRNLGKWVLSGATGLAGVLLGLLAWVDTIEWFYVIWAGIGIAMAGALYDPCFAYLIRALALDARRAITTITLIAGFAGTVAFPVATVAAAEFGWRAAVLACGLVLFVAVAPAFWWAANQIDRSVHRSAPSHGASRTGAMVAVRNIKFWLIGLALGLIAINHGMIITHLLPLLAERGISLTIAVTAAATIGVMQVAGRLTLVAFGRSLSAAGTMLACIFALLVAGIALFMTGTAAIWVVLFVTLYGAGWGVASIAKPLFIRDVLGEQHYGIVAGLLAVPFLLAIASGPIVGSLLWTMGTYDLVILVGTTLLIGALLCVALARGLGSS